MQRTMRMKREMEMLTKSPPHGISCWVQDDKLDKLEAQIIGADGTPYEGGIFKLEIQIPERYPFEPPKVRFVTPIYHPNIDTGGRICLDTLKMPPKGAWKPCLNVGTVLTSIQLLMSEPNPEDPLMTDISNEFKYNKVAFQLHAKEWTAKYAKEQNLVPDKENPMETSSSGKVFDSTAGESSSSSGEKRKLPMMDVTNKKLKLDS